MLGEEKLRVPLATVLGGIKDAREPPEVGVERGHLVLLTHGLQARAQHHIQHLSRAGIEVIEIAATQVERERPPVELMRASDDRAGLADILPRLLGLQGLTDRLARKVVQVRFEGVLGRHEERQAHDGPLGHLIEERVHGIAAQAPLA